jgi:hypothetical protein
MQRQVIFQWITLLTILKKYHRSALYHPSLATNREEEIDLCTNFLIWQDLSRKIRRLKTSLNPPITPAEKVFLRRVRFSRQNGQRNNQEISS